jgi:hypothetical protein
MEMGYRQIWIAAMRHHREIPAELKRKQRSVHKKQQADEAILCNLASLIYQLGFSSDKILTQLQVSPYRALARDTFRKARDPERYKFPNLDDLVEQLVAPFLGRD